MILGGWTPGRLSLRRPPFWQPAFGLVPNSVVLPHFDEFPAWVRSTLFAVRPRGSFAIGVDAHTALISRAGAWAVLGRGEVEARGRGAGERYSANQQVRL
jgi:hypothetical protein